MVIDRIVFVNMLTIILFVDRLCITHNESTPINTYTI